MGKKRPNAQEQLEDQQRRQAEFEKEMERLMKLKEYSVEPDGTVITYENPKPFVTDEMMEEEKDEWPEWKRRYYENYTREGACNFCTKNKEIKLGDITSYTYENEQGEVIESGPTKCEIKYCPVCGKMLKQIRSKESFNNNYVIEQYLLNRERRKREREMEAQK